jgi:hypothetical protein
MKRRSSKPAGKVVEPVPYDRRVTNFSKFKPDLTIKDFQKLLKPFGGIVVFPFAPIETLSCTKTIGKGRTNLTIIVPTIVQIDAASPRASFDRRSTPSRNPIIQMHFEPIAYGITAPATYVMEFTIEAFGVSTFNLDGFAGSATIVNKGSKTLNGPSKVSLIMQNVPPTQQTFGFLEQKTGGAWDWLSAQVRFPPLVLTL